MDNERIRPEDPISVENKKENTTETVNSVPLQPLILKQNPKNIKGTKSLPYDFNAETYDVYSNPKNPFLVGILAAETDKIQLDSLFYFSLKSTPPAGFFHYPFIYFLLYNTYLSITARYLLLYFWHPELRINLMHPSYQVAPTIPPVSNHVAE